MDVMRMQKRNAKHRKAFFFSGAVAILLVLLISSAALWVVFSNTRSARAPLLGQGQESQNFENSLLSYHDRVLQVAAEISLYETNKQIFTSKILYADKAALQTYFCSSPSNPKALATTIGTWKDQIVKLGNEMGLQVSITFGACSISMQDYRTVKVEYPITSYVITDKVTGAKLTGSLTDPAFIDIEGFDDPFVHVQVYEKVAGAIVYKQIYFHDSIRTPSDAVPTPIAQGIRGKGWFYGRAIDVASPPPSPSDPCNQKPEDCIGVVYENPVGWNKLNPPPLSALEPYGALIIIGAPDQTVDPREIACVNGDPLINGQLVEEVPTWCVDCLRYVRWPESIDPNLVCYYELPDGSGPDLTQPVLSPLGTYIDAWQGKPFITVDSITHTKDEFVGKYVVMGSRYWYNDFPTNSPKRVWTIEKLRALTSCGFYVNNPFHAPDFLQRMTRLWKNEASSPYNANGIEGFVIGPWIENEKLTGEVYSSVDHVRARYVPGSLDALTPLYNEMKLKGTPGCKQWSHCAAISQVSFGHFALDDDIAELGFSHVADYDPAYVIACKTPDGLGGYYEYYASCGGP